MRLTPHILGLPKLIDSGKINEKEYYLVLTLYDSDSSNLKMRFKSKTTFNTILELGIQAIKGLQNLHSIGFVHCDLKPLNILHNNIEDGGWTDFTLIDFGISSKYLDEDGNHIPQTMAAYFSGSLEFMATECMQKIGKFVPATSILDFTYLNFCVASPTYL